MHTRAFSRASREREGRHHTHALRAHRTRRCSLGGCGRHRARAIRSNAQWPHEDERRRYSARRVHNPRQRQRSVASMITLNDAGAEPATHKRRDRVRGESVAWRAGLDRRPGLGGVPGGRRGLAGAARSILVIRCAPDHTAHRYRAHESGAVTLCAPWRACMRINRNLWL
jgi:hypothetical protein